MSIIFALPFPPIGPVAIEIGPLVVRWYALSYIAGILIGWRYCLWLAGRPPTIVTRAELDDFVVWATLGVLLGGRLGYVLLYQSEFYFQNPLAILRLWEGGMSFHGGLAGVIAAMILFAWRRGRPFFALADILAAATPIGLFLGRLANFVNGELYGRASDVPWAMVFPSGGPDPRHPSQLYQAGLEGLVLFVALFVLVRFAGAKARQGFLSGAFLFGYGVARIVGELFREPDTQIGFFIGGTTMGQWLSVPLLAFGLVFMLRARKAA
jgi:phosphatidylglycerol:prolipoprotein diacylglycerol transferase